MPRSLPWSRWWRRPDCVPFAACGIWFLPVEAWKSLLAYEALGLRDFFTAVFTAVFGFVSDLASVLPLGAAAAFFSGAGRERAGLGFASGAASVTASDATRAAAGAGRTFSSGALETGLDGTFFTFFAASASSAAGAGGATGWSPFAITSPLYTQHLTPITP